MTSSIGFFGDESSLLHWLERVFNRCSINNAQLAIMICWGLWQNQNGMVWRGKLAGVHQLLNSAGHFLYKLAGVHQLLNSAGHFLYQWHTARKHQFLVSQSSNAGHGAVCWETPPRGRLKCNVDATVFDSRGQIGLGSVIRDSTGAFVAARCRCIRG